MFDFLRRDSQSAPEAKASAAGRVLAYAASGRVAWSARDTSSLTRTGFTGNPVGFRAVKLISEAAAALPLVLEENGARMAIHPVLKLIGRPNDGQAQAEFLEALYGQILLTGNGYVEAVAEESGSLSELHVLRSDRMRLVPGSDGWPVAYEYKVGSKAHRFDAWGISPVCHIKAFHPQDDHYGLSPLQAAAAAIDVHNAASAWSKGLLDNAARPSGAIVYGGGETGATMTADQFDRLSAEIEANHQGARNAGRPMLLEGGLDWKPMGFSPSDMEFQKTKEAAAREIATAFGIPPMMLGIPGDATYANYQEANRAFYRLTVLPLVQKVTAALSHWLSLTQPQPVMLKPDLDQVPALSVERDAHWQRVTTADFLSEKEKRALLGLPPLEAGDE